MKATLLKRLWLLLWLLFAGGTLPLITWGYGAQPSCVSTYYDAPPASTTDYDSTPVLVGNERRARESAGCAVFGKFPGFLAAETTGPVRAGEITTFQDFVDRSVVGDNLEGHELWQHANLKAQGLATERLSTAASQNNPVIALDSALHQQVNAAQRAIDAAAQTPLQNINANATILRILNVAPQNTIDLLQQQAIQHARSLGH
jgi:hypothetical protein